MSTKSSLIVIAAIAFLAVAGMGAARFVGSQDTNSQPARTEAIHLGDQMALHADALADARVRFFYGERYGERYGEVPSTWPEFDAATASHLRVIEQHGDALQETTP